MHFKVVLTALIFSCQYAVGYAQLVTQTEFVNAVTAFNYKKPTPEQYNTFVNSAGPLGSIWTKQEAAMILTHILHESGGFQHVREHGCEGSNGCAGKYSWNCDVPGQSYYGRGYMQLTWCYNYRGASSAILGSDELLRNLDLVAQRDDLSWKTAFWFWKENVHSRDGVAQGRFGVTTNAVNGGEECRGNKQDIARKRFSMYKRILQAFHLDPNSANETGCYN